MAGFVDTISESFKQTLNWSMWLYFFLVLLIEGIVTGIIALIFVFVGFLVFLGPITSVGGIENIGILLSNPSFIISYIGVIGLLFLVFIIIATFIEAIFTGIRYNLFNDFLKTGNFNLGKSFQKTKPRVFTFFIISIIVSLVILAVLAIAFAPMLFVLPGLIGSSVAGSSAGLVLAPVLFGLLLAFLVAIVLLLISPMLALLAPAAFFEEKGAIATIKKAFGLMKANYFGNLAYLVLYVLIVVAIRMLLQVLFLPLTLLLGLIDASGAGAAGFVGLFVFAGIILFIIMLVYIVWSTVFDTACFRNLYFLDKSLLSGHAPKHSANPKHRAKKKKAKKRKNK